MYQNAKNYIKIHFFALKIWIIKLLFVPLHQILRNRKTAQRKRTFFVRKITKFFRYMKIKK